MSLGTNTQFRRLAMPLKTSTQFLLRDACAMYNVDDALAEAIIMASSGGVPNFCSFSKHCQLVNTLLPCPSASDVDTECVLQRTRWGLFGLFGYAARKTGFQGWFSTLLNAAPNIEYGVRHLAKMSVKYSGDDLLSAFNYGSPRHHDNGYANAQFIDKVKRYM